MEALGKAGGRLAPRRDTPLGDIPPECCTPNGLWEGGRLDPL